MQNQRNSTVLVVKPDGSTEQINYNGARRLADDIGLDLVEVNSHGPKQVFKMMDKGKWQYDQKKKKKKQAHAARSIKEMKFRLKIDKHDLDTKINKIRKFIEKEYDVRLVIQMKGRELRHPDLAYDKLNEVLSELDGVIKPESIKRQSSIISVVIHPKKE